MSQNEQYCHLGYVLLEYVTQLTIRQLPDAEQDVLYADLASAGLRDEVLRVGPMTLLMEASRTNEDKSKLLMGALTQAIQGAKPQLANLLKTHGTEAILAYLKGGSPPLHTNGTVAGSGGNAAAAKPK